jgi:hypothetical protein
MIVRWIIGIGLLFGILLVMLPKTDDEALVKIGSASMLMCTMDFREQVAHQVIRKETITADFNNTCPELIASVELDEQGGILIVGNKYPVKMSLSPVVESGKVRWSCQGDPAEAVTKLCKP